MQAVVVIGVVWLARVVWLAYQRQLFLVPHFSSQSKKKSLVQELISIILLTEFPVIIKI